MGPGTGFDDDAIMLDKRGSEICPRSFDVSPAAGYNQGRSHRRMRDRLHGPHSALVALYGEYYASVAAYNERWRLPQQRLTAEKAMYAADRQRRYQEGVKKDDQGPTGAANHRCEIATTVSA